MKYTAPNFEVEIVETADVINASHAIPGVDPNNAFLNDVVDTDGNVIGQEVVIPDVSILL